MPASKRQRRTSLVAVIDRARPKGGVNAKPALEQARSSLFNCVFRGKAFGRIEKTLKGLLVWLITLSIVSILIESAAEISSGDSLRVLLLRIVFEAIEWTVFTAMVLEFAVRFAVLDWVPGFWETSVTMEMAVRRATGDRAAEGLRACLCSCGPCAELSARPVGICKTMRLGLCCPLWYVCHPCCCPSELTVGCMRITSRWCGNGCCFGRQPRAMSRRSSARVHTPPGCCHAASRLTDAEVATILLATDCPESEGAPASPAAFAADGKRGAAGRPVASDPGPQKPPPRPSVPRKAASKPAPSPTAWSAEADEAGRQSKAGAEDATGVRPASLTATGADEGGGHRGTASGPARGGRRQSAGWNALMAASSRPEARLAQVSRAQSAALSEAKGPNGGGEGKAAAPGRGPASSPRGRRASLQRRRGAGPAASISPASPVASWDGHARRPLFGTAPAHGFCACCWAGTLRSRAWARLVAMQSSGVTRAVVPSARPAEVSAVVPTMGAEVFKEAAHCSTTLDRHGGGGDSPISEPDATDAASGGGLARPRVSPGQVAPASSLRVRSSQRRAGCCRVVSRRLCCLCSCGWCCGQDELAEAAEPPTPTRSRGEGAKRFVSVGSLLRSADCAEDGNVSVEVPLALARVARRQRGHDPSRGGGVLRFAVPFGPVLRPGGEIFVPSPADKRRLRLGGAISRALFLLCSPGFALDAFLLVPPLLHIAGVSNVFQPGNPSRTVVALRVMRLARAFKLLRYTPGSHQLLSVAQGKMEALLTSLVICFAFSLMLASAVFAAEYETNPDFASMVSAMWFACVTVTTVGFGDVVPHTSMGRFCGALLALTGTALYAMPPAIIATGYLEHRELDRRAKMSAFEKLFDRKRRLVLHSALLRLRMRARTASKLLARAIKRQQAAGEEIARQAEAAGKPLPVASLVDLDASDLELITAQRLYQQQHSVEAAQTSDEDSDGPDSGRPRRSLGVSGPPPGQLMRFATRTMQARSGLTGEAAGAGASFLAGAPAHVTSAAKALLTACKGDLSAGMRALCDAERWAASPLAAGDESSLPDLVRLRTATRPNLFEQTAGLPGLGALHGSRE